MHHLCITVENTKKEKEKEKSFYIHYVSMWNNPYNIDLRLPKKIYISMVIRFYHRL